MRFAGHIVRALRSEAINSRRLSAEAAKVHKQCVSDVLDSIVRKVVDYPACPRSEMLIVDFPHRPVGSRRLALTAPVQAANMSDGVGLLVTTDTPHDDQVHRLMLPFGGEVGYWRRSTDIDGQSTSVPDIEAAGLDQLAAHPEIYPFLNYCLGALAVESSQGWPNAFQ